MLGIFISIYNFVKLFLILSYKTGQWLTNCVLFILKTFQTVVTVLLDTFEALEEDFRFFCGDLISRLSFSIEIIYSSLCLMLYYIKEAYLSVKNFTNVVFLFQSNIRLYCSNVCDKLLNCVGEVIVFIQELFLLIGLGTWFALTKVTCLLISFVSELKLFLQLHFNFPLEIICGLSAVIFMLYIILKFRLYDHNYIKSIIRLYFPFIVRYFNNQNSDEIQPRQNSESGEIQLNQNFTEENFKCIVCYDNSRNILLLPCRHFCLCTDCNNMMNDMYQRTCPLCRRRVRSSIKVYV